MGNDISIDRLEAYSQSILSSARYGTHKGEGSPLHEERSVEEQSYSLLMAIDSPKVCKIYFYIDENGFVVAIEGGNKRGQRYAIIIKIVDHTDITYHECQACRAAFKLGERGTSLKEHEFRSWKSKLEKFGTVQLEKDSQGVLLLTVDPKPFEKSKKWMKELPGLINRTAIHFDHGDFFVLFITDEAKYIISIALEKRDRSFSDLQCQAAYHALKVSEQGDKMDDSIFFQYCARLQMKYGLMKVAGMDGIKMAYIMPTKLTPEDAGVLLTSEYLLPPVHDGKITWSDTTQERVARILVEIRESPAKLQTSHQQEQRRLSSLSTPTGCSGCADPGAISRGRYRYECTECPGRYVLCQSCYEDERETQSHESSHAMKRIKINTTAIPSPQQSPSPVNPPAPLPGVPPIDPEASHLVFEGGAIRATKLIKRSGQADVYRGFAENTRLRTRKDVAIKVFRAEKDWKACRVELKVLLRLPKHPNVMEVLDFFQLPKSAFVMRFVDGGNLRDRLNEYGKFQGEALRRSLEGIGKGLKHLHENRIVHRDLKSLNILLEGSELRPVLIDLGFGSKLEDWMTHDITSHMKGTALWMAPEMMSHYKWSFKTDMYSLGIICWEIMTGMVPFNFYQPVQVIHRVSQGERPDEQELCKAGASEIQQQLVKKLWDQDPGERPTIEEFLQQIDR